MADEKQLNLLKSGVDTWNKWRKEHPEVSPDLRKADLTGTDLFEAYLALF
jgi:hypothetical protein